MYSIEDLLHDTSMSAIERARIHTQIRQPPIELGDTMALRVEERVIRTYADSAIGLRAAQLRDQDRAA